MSAQSLKRILSALYTLITFSIFISALVSPTVRTYAPAPLRDWALNQILPPVTLSILYSTEKEMWLQEAITEFQKTSPQIDGRPIQIKLKKMGSREIYLAVLDGTEKPDVVSPASLLQISILESLSTNKFSKPIVSVADTATCRPVLKTPLVLVAWRERATALWGDDPNSQMWKRLHDALIQPKGWEAYGHPEWGFIKFGHTSPLKSNSGFMTILLMTYNYLNKTSGLSSNDILANSEYQKWFKETEGTISEFGDSTGTYMKDMVTFGPSKHDFITVYEASAIEQADNAVGRYGELRFYYPPATVMSDHPFCTLKTEWVTEEKSRAATLFVNFLLSKPMQESALFKYGFRPVDTTIALDQTGSPFQRYEKNGLRIQLPSEVQIPSGDVLNTLLDFWSRSIQK